MKRNIKKIVKRIRAKLSFRKRLFRFKQLLSPLFEGESKYPYINYLKAKMQLGLGFGNKAESLIENAILGKEKADYYYILGRAMQKQAKWRFSCDAYERALELGYKGRKSIFYKHYAESLMKMWWHDRASDMWACYFESHKSPSKKDYVFAALSALKSGRKEEAENYLQKALKKQGENSFLGYGILFEELGYWKEANKYYLETIESTSDKIDPLVYYKAGLSFDRMYRFEEATPYILKCLETKEEGYIYSRLGFVYEKLGEWEKAYNAHINALSLSKKFNSNWNYRAGYSLFKLGRFKASCEQFITTMNQAAFKVDKKLMQNKFFALAYQLEKEEKWSEAAENYQKAIYSTSNLITRQYQKLGYCLYKLGKFEKSSKAFLEQRIIWDEYKGKKKKLTFEQKYTEYYNNLDIREKIVFYECYAGDKIACSPYAMFKELYFNQDNDYIHFFAIKSEDRIPEKLKNLDNVYFVKRNSDMYLRLLTMAKYLINNSTFSNYIHKDGQKYLNTWHGTPMKSMGKYLNETSFISAKNVVRNFYQATHILSPNLFTHGKMLVDSYWISDVVKNKKAVIGYPRQDSMLNMSDEEKTTLKNQLGIKLNKKVVLYAPTWRGVANKATNVDNEMISKILAYLSKNKEVTTIYLGHNFNYDQKKIEIENVVVPVNVDTNEILSITDILITDYSSIAIDFMPMDKPIIYFTYDLEEYTRERGLYFPITDLSDNVVQTFEELEKRTLELFENPFIDEKQKAAKERFCYLDDGNATKRAIEFFFNDDETCVIKESDERKNILIFPGHFLKNGITTSALNLIQSIDRAKYNITILVSDAMIEKSTEQYIFDTLVNQDFNFVILHGKKFMTIEETSVQSQFFRNYEMLSSGMEEIFKKSGMRDYRRMFGTTQFDIVIDFSSYNRDCTLVLADSDAKTKLVFLHNDMLGEKEVRFPYLDTILKKYKHFDKIVSVSRATCELNKENLAEKYNLSLEKFTHFDNIQNSNKIIDMSKEVLEIEDEDLFENSKVFLAIGRFSPEKNHEKMIRAFNLVLKENSDKNLKLLIIGGGPLQLSLEKLISELGIGQNVKLLGLRNNPYSYIGKADCFLSSSDHEGQPMTLFEALILGKDIIATDITGNRAVLEGRGGMLVENTVDGLAEAINDYIRKGESQDYSFSIDDYNRSALENFYKLFEA